MPSILIEDWRKYMVYTCGSVNQSADVKPLVGESTACEETGDESLRYSIHGSLGYR